MRLWVFILLFLAPAVADAAPKSTLWSFWDRSGEVRTAPDFHGDWGGLINRYLSRGRDGVARFDYAAVTAADRALLDAYLERLADSDVLSLHRADQMAYWLNFYNALTVRLILTHYPVDTIRDIDISPGWFSDGPWGAKLVTVQGQEVSLDDIEHRILRPIWQDPRVHYGVNCASVGCPDLAPEPFDPMRLDTQLDAAARIYVNHPRAVRVNEAGRVTASSIYDWFRKDFGDSEAGVIAHVLSYAKPELAQKLQGVRDISAYEYDWSLNAP